MRTEILVIGAFIFVVSIIGYMTLVPGFTEKMMSSFLPSGGTNSVNSLQTVGLLRQMGIPPFEDVDNYMHLGSLGGAFAGMGTMVIGVLVRKKVSKKTPVKKEEEDETTEEPIEALETYPERTLKETPRSIHILQERLARGDITPKEYEDLKRFIENS